MLSCVKLATMAVMNDIQQRKLLTRMAIGLAVLDLGLAALAFVGPNDAVNWFVVVLMGLVVSQIGLCCTVGLRNENFREDAAFWIVMLLLLTVAVVSFPDKTDAEISYGAVFTAIGFGVSLAVNTLPTLTIRWFWPNWQLRFSIVQIMLLTALVAVLAMLVRLTGMWLFVFLAIIAVVMGPAALASFLLSQTQRPVLFFALLLLTTATIGLFWFAYPEMAPIFVFLLAQAVGSMIGGAVLLRIEPDQTFPQPPPAKTESESPFEGS